jgi:putative PIN family toxin of toxin-antitoxin system
MKIGLDWKIVIDTNVFVSGVFFSGPPYQILKAWQLGEFELVVSQEILDEYQRVGNVLAEEYPGIDLNPILSFVIEHAKVYQTIDLKEPVCEDSDDDKFIACALASGSRVIISGDKHLLKVSGYKGIEVMKPRKFIDSYLR